MNKKELHLNMMMELLDQHKNCGGLKFYYNGIWITAPILRYHRCYFYIKIYIDRKIGGFPIFIYDEQIHSCVCQLMKDRLPPA